MEQKHQPIRFPSEASRRLSPILNSDEIEAQDRACAEEDESKLQALCQHFGIDPGPSAFHQLALVLARKLYPERKRAGRKSKWTDLNRGVLVVEIERLVNPGDETHGVTWAATQLANREPWRSFIKQHDRKESGADAAEVLRRAYYDFKNDRWAKMSRKAFKWHEQEGTIAEWKMFVDDVVRNPHFQ